MFEVVYYSMTGNTRKVADAIGAELGVTARGIKSVDKLGTDATVFLGTGCYTGVVPKEIGDFIERTQLKGRKIAVFYTSGFGIAKEREAFLKYLQNRGVEVIGTYNCFGKFAAVRMGHPNTAELEAARQFARSLTTGSSSTANKPKPAVTVKKAK